MKLCLIDTETTGTDHTKHGLIQFAGCIIINGVIKEWFDFKVKPFKGLDLIAPKALEINKTTIEQLEKYAEPAVVYLDFQTLLAWYVDKHNPSDKFHFVGWNADFDADFIRRFFEKNGDVYFSSWFWFPIVDVAKLVGIRMMRERPTFPNFKLRTVCERLGLGWDETLAHNARYDIKKTLELFQMCIHDLVPVKKEIANGNA